MESLNRRSLKGLALTQRPKFKVPPWREAERYFKRYRDTKKVIPLRPQTKIKGNAKTDP